MLLPCRHILKFREIKGEDLFSNDLIGTVFLVVSKSGGPGLVPNSYFLYYIFIKALILIKFEHNA
jgi:hypothetical protein